MANKTAKEKVYRNPLYIQFINNPSEKIQLTAVRENNWAINYIKNPSMSVIKACNKK